MRAAFCCVITSSDSDIADISLPVQTGVEGVETALKLCRKWAYEVKVLSRRPAMLLISRWLMCEWLCMSMTTQKVPQNQAKIIFCEGNFHGRTFAYVPLKALPSPCVMLTHASLQCHFCVDRPGRQD